MGGLIEVSDLLIDLNIVYTIIIKPPLNQNCFLINLFLFFSKYNFIINFYKNYIHKFYILSTVFIPRRPSPSFKINAVFSASKIRASITFLFSSFRIEFEL